MKQNKMRRREARDENKRIKREAKENKIKRRRIRKEKVNKKKRKTKKELFDHFTFINLGKVHLREGVRTKKFIKNSFFNIFS